MEPVEQAEQGDQAVQLVEQQPVQQADQLDQAEGQWSEAQKKTYLLRQLLMQTYLLR